jgi:hypothetical protein
MSRWRLAGTVLIACNCDWGCPCNFNARPTQGHCEGGWSWLIEEGTIEDLDLAGLAVSVYAAWPGAIHEGNGQAVAYLDVSANDARRAVLTRLLRGELGGPWGIFSKTYTLAGPHPAAYRAELAEHRSRLRIGDMVQLELEPIHNPVTKAETHPEIVLPQGLVVKRASLAASRVFQVEQEVRYDHSGKYTAFGRFQYEGATA